MTVPWPALSPHSAAVEWAREVLSRGDTRLAILAGPSTWRDESSPPTVQDSAAACVQLAATMACAFGPPYPWQQSQIDAGPRWTAAVVAAIALCALSRDAISQVVRRRPARADFARRPRVFAVLRGALAVLAFTAWMFPAPATRTVMAPMLGVLLGSDSVRTCWLIGVEPRPWARLGGFFTSGLHIGAAAATASALVWASEQGRESALSVYVTVVVAAVFSALTMAVLDGLLSRGDDAQRELEQRIRATQHEELAHWLHDDVTSALRLTRLRAESGHLGQAELLTELDDLEHRLRERQLDEIIAAGGTPLSDIAQPYIRRAQQRNVTIAEVPRFEVASLMLGRTQARLAQRSLAGLIGNALNAGATTIALHAQFDPLRKELVLQVEDDAGGFDLADVPHGRGIDRLRRDLGEGALTAVRTDQGSVVSVRLKIS